MLREILEKRFTAKWWSDKPIEQEKLDYILDCAYSAPSKNGKYNYEIFVLGDSEKSNEIKHWLYCENTYCIGGERLREGPIGHRRYNGQVLAPTVLVWVAKHKNEETFNDCLVSSTIAMIASEEQGINTGFNGCLGEKETAEKLGRYDSSHAPIAMGLGYIDKMDDDIQREVYKDNVKYGFDYGNVKPEIRRGPNRVGKKTKDELIHLM